ncbi:hypothetical protein F5B20DRAFT_558973 [Whalleya microplaca]|nr:hypothetical protein F5B20DRAFT_558973 [Whalleya microplaca]
MSQPVSDQFSRAYCYEQDFGRFNWKDNDRFDDYLRSCGLEQLGVNDAHQFRLNIVILLEAAEESPRICISREQFNSLRDEFRIPISSIRTLLNEHGQPTLARENGQHTHAIEYSQVGGRELPVSLCISMQTPPLESESFSLLLRVSVQTNSGSCIIIVRNQTTAESISQVLHDHYRSIRLYPLHVLDLLCGQLDQVGEKYCKVRYQAFEELQKKMHVFCYAHESLYKDGGKAVYGVIHNLNIQRRKLIDLDYVTGFQLSVLRFAETINTTYQEMRTEANKPDFSRDLLETFRQGNESLDIAAKLRQKRRQGLEKRAELDVGILCSSNSQHDIQISLEENITIKVISFITLFFLPLSLVATISSSNAFDFNKHDAGRDVLTWHYWWILIVVAIGLTLVAFLSCYLYLRYNRVVKKEPASQINTVQTAGYSREIERSPTKHLGLHYVFKRRPVSLRDMSRAVGEDIELGAVRSPRPSSQNPQQRLLPAM